MITLAGAPQVVVADADALGHEAWKLLAGLGLDVLTDVPHELTLAVPSVGLFVRARPVIEGCFAWYVGKGHPPTWMHPTEGLDARTSARILALLGTGFAQERAGAAFRAAGTGLAIPPTTPYNAAAILPGITAAVAPAVASAPNTCEVGDVDELLRQSFAAIDRCCAPNGAIAAAPVRAGGPDYWFFWQRDAAHVAYALHLLSVHGPADLRQAAGHRAASWVRFVSKLGPHLAALDHVGSSRCSMSGDPIGGYGDPQHDGPAATALVLLSVVADPAAALVAARPYLEHLLRDHAAGYDLWELVRGRSFHAENLRGRVLRKAADAADLIGDPDAARLRSAGERDRLVDFRQDGSLRHMLHAEPPWFDLLSGTDVSAVGSVLLACETLEGAATSDLAAVVEELVRHSARRGSGGIMRFPEDTNDGLGSTGGRPWPVATLWIAQWYLRRSRDPLSPVSSQDRRAGLGHLNAVLASDTAALGEQLEWGSAEARGARPLAWSHAELIVTLLLL